MLESRLIHKETQFLYISACSLSVLYGCLQPKAFVRTTVAGVSAELFLWLYDDGSFSLLVLSSRFRKSWHFCTFFVGFFLYEKKSGRFPIKDGHDRYYNQDRNNPKDEDEIALFNFWKIQRKKRQSWTFVLKKVFNLIADKRKWERKKGGVGSPLCIKFSAELNPPFFSPSLLFSPDPFLPRWERRNYSAESLWIQSERKRGKLWLTFFAGRGEKRGSMCFKSNTVWKYSV